MKSALVLGLALAANAQVDNELATSWYNPSNPSGADLVRNAGWGRHLPIPTRSTFTRFDEAADDELATSPYTPYNPSGADLVRNAGWGRHLPIPNRSTFTRFDDSADDELLVNLWNPSGADLANHRGRPETDKYGRPYTDMRGNPLGRPVYRDDEADDELLVNLWSPSGADLANHRGRPETDKYGRPYTDMRGNPLGRPVYRDDEFMSLSGADLVKYAKQSQSTTYRPVAHVVRDDEADDELAAFPSHPSGADLVRNAGWGRSQPIHTPPKHTNLTYWSKNDDVVDDELAYLGHLIRETLPEKTEKKPEIRRKLRPVEKN